MFIIKYHAKILEIITLMDDTGGIDTTIIL